MVNDKTYIFVRPESQSLPPRFSKIIDELEERGVYNANLEHPKANWNVISITLSEDEVNYQKIEEAFMRFGCTLTS